MPDAFKVPNKIPKWMKPKFILDNGWLEVGEKLYQYHIISRKFELGLKGFVGYPEGEFLFISEDVPREYHPYILTHEVLETTILKGKAGRCAFATILELGDVPPGMLREYIKYRLDFLNRLLEFYKDRDDLADLQIELLHSRNILQETKEALDE